MTATLQATVADLRVLAQLGWLSTAQSWSGFGAGGDKLVDEAEAPPLAPARKAKQPSDSALKVVAATETTEADAAQTVQARRDDVAALQQQQRCDDLRAQLQRAERELAAAQAAPAAAVQEHAEAQAVVAEARRRLSGDR